MTGNKINFCLIGAGRMGGRWADLLGENKKTNLSLIIDANEKLASEVAEKHGVPYSAKFGNNLDNIDAVIVATPHRFLFEYAYKALNSNKHVLVEKPGSRNKNEMKKLIKLAKKKNLVLMVGYNHRFIDGVFEAKNLVDEGRIGKVLFIRICYGHEGRPGYEKEWRMNKREAGGGVIMDQGTHVIDLANWFLSSTPSVIKNIQSNNYWKAKVEENAFILLKNKEKQLVSLHVSITQWKPTFVVEIFGTKGYLIASGLGKKYNNGEKLEIGYLDKNHKVSKKVKKYKVEPFNSIRMELEYFISSVKKRQIEGPSGEDGLKVLKVIEKIYKSYV